MSYETIALKDLPDKRKSKLEAVEEYDRLLRAAAEDRTRAIVVTKIAPETASAKEVKIQHVRGAQAALCNYLKRHELKDSYTHSIRHGVLYLWANKP